MENMKEKVKKLLSVQLKKSVLKQKNEWPATSTPVYFQPIRPNKEKFFQLNDSLKKIVVKTA